MAVDQRRNDRVAFERGFPAMITSLDGKWRMACAMDDVSDDGAKLRVNGNAENITAKEFLLLLSANGKALRRCELSWAKGSELGVRFVKPERRKRDAAKPGVGRAQDGKPDTAKAAARNEASNDADAAGPVVEI